MIRLVSLPAKMLCNVVENTAKIFSDAFVSESLREAQEQMGDNPSMGLALAAFSENIAPVLLGDKHKAATLSILRALRGETDGGAETIRDLFSLLLMDREYATLVAAVKHHGENAVLAALYKYGTPPDMHLLAGLLDAQTEQREWRIYVGDTIAALLRAVCGKSASGIPTYSDILKRTATAYDSRSGAEIVEQLKAKFEKRKEQRNHEDL